MARHSFCYSRTLGNETFKVEGADSFDEARKIVDKAVYERKLEIEQSQKKSPTPPLEPLTNVGPMLSAK